MPLSPARPGRVAWEVAAWLLLGVALWEWAQRLRTGGVDLYANADIAYLPTLIEDVLVRGHPFLHSWHLTAAPYFFPDGLLCLLARVVVARIEAVQVLAVVLQVLAVAGTARAFLAASCPDDAGVAALGPALVALGVSLGLLGQSGFDLLVHPAYHTGVTIVVLAAGALVVAPPGRRPRWRTAAVITLVLLGGASDSLVVLWGLAAGLVCGAWIWRARRLHRAPDVEVSSLRLGLWAGAAAVGATLLRRMAVPFPDKSHDRLRLGQLPETLAQGWADWGRYSPALKLALVAGFALLVFTALRGRTARLRFAATLAAASSAVVGLAILATGYLSDGGWFRYLLAPAMAGLLAPAWWARPPWAKALLGVAAAGVVAVSLSPGAWAWPPQLPDFRVRAQVACVDALAQREGAHVVLAGYWTAKPLTLLSTKGVRAAQLGPEADALYLWITSRAWYGPFDEAGLVLANGLDEARLRERFGEPAEVVACGEWTVQVYRGEGRQAVRRFLEETVTRTIGAVPR